MSSPLVTRLRIIRTCRGETIREIPTRIGICPATLNRIDRGYSYAPAKWRKPLDDALGVRTSEIFDQFGWPLIHRSKEPVAV